MTPPRAARLTLSMDTRMEKNPSLFFLETNILQDKLDVIFTLGDNDVDGIPSLKRLYLTMEDPYEVFFARTYFESFSRWQSLCDLSWFQPHITEWRKELEAQVRAKALLALREEAESATSNSFQANKFLLQGGWISKDSPSRGRPSKESIRKAATEIARSGGQIEKDMARLGIVSSKGVAG